MFKVKKASVPYKAGGFTTIAHAMNYAAQSNSGIRFFDDRGSVIAQASYAQVRQEALRLVTYLKTLNIPRGSYVAMLAETRLEFHIVFFACQYLGLIPSPLPFTILPAGREAYENKLTQLLKVVKAVLLVTPASIAPVAQNVGTVCNTKVVTYEELIQNSSTFEPVGEHALTPLTEDEAAYVQFSSGSTAEPSGLLITQKAVMSNLNTIAAHGIRVIENEQIFSWLPFDHDMGLVSFVLSVVNTQSNADYISPATFMRSPELWLELMSAHRSTMTFAPVFAYALALQKIDSQKKLDLSALRAAGIGGDMIHAETLRAFARKMEGSGFRFDAFCPGYGLAEATMGVTLTLPEEPPFIKKFSGVHHTQELVSCGKAMLGYEVKIIRSSDSVSTAHAIGEVWVKGPSIVTTLLNAAKKLVMDEQGFIPTGDLGFLYEDHLFITGRVKDMIIVRGRNIWAQDVEWVVRTCDEEIQEQSVAAIGITEGVEERLVVLLEDHLSDAAMRAELGSRMIEAINQNFGVKAQLVWVTPKQFATTTVGKLARAEIKKCYLNGSYALLTA